MKDRLSCLVESQQFSRQLLEKLFNRADDIRKKPKKYNNSLKGKIAVDLFYESSTRTRLSFESAMLRLGGSYIGTENAKEFSSVSKGESLEDTVRVVSFYGDIIVMRHDEDGSSKLASQLATVPVINGGDGRGQHPTQALIDVYTLYREFGKVDNLKLAIVGDLANGRTVRSLAYLCAKFKGISIDFVSPSKVRVKNDIKSHLIEHNVPFVESENLEEVMPKVDAIYMTRTQKERMSEEDYKEVKGKYGISEDNLHLIGKKARILHPLPHTDEIKLPLAMEKTDPRVAYFRQAENGLYARMALLHYLLARKI